DHCGDSPLLVSWSLSPFRPRPIDSSGLGAGHRRGLAHAARARPRGRLFRRGCLGLKAQAAGAGARACRQRRYGRVHHGEPHQHGSRSGGGRPSCQRVYRHRLASHRLGFPRARRSSVPQREPVVSRCRDGEL
ncbi:MAG: hypothetical protein AVDCRST_MAG45-680, partial [uncultured Solirubrobacterales bacterium]